MLLVTSNQHCTMVYVLVLFKNVLSACACPFRKTSLLLYLVVKVVVMVAVNVANIIVLLILIVNIKFSL